MQIESWILSDFDKGRSVLSEASKDFGKVKYKVDTYNEAVVLTTNIILQYLKVEQKVT